MNPTLPPMPVEALSEIGDLPLFVLFQDLVVEDEWDEGSPILSFSAALAHPDFERLEDTVPRPVLPTDPQLLTALGETSRAEDWTDDSGAFDPTAACFTIRPEHPAESPTDAEAFGTSWQLIWLCSPDRQRIVAALLETLDRNQIGNTGPIGVSTLLGLWQDHLDLIRYHPPLPPQLATSWWPLFVDELMAQVNLRPDAPTPEAWDEVDRYL